MYKISIIMPIFNSEKYLLKAVNSVLTQTYNNFELILVDDGSTDKSLEICNSFLHDSRVKVIEQKNSGVSSARNTGIKKANGDWVMFIDSDDCIDKDMLYSMVESIKTEEIDFIFCGFKKKFFDEKNNDKFIREEEFCCKDILMNKETFLNKIEEFIDKCLLQGPWGKLFKMNIIKENKIVFDEKISYGEDTLFVYTYLKYINNAKCLNGAFYNYNVFNNNSLNLKFRRDKFQIHLRINKTLESLIKKYNKNFQMIINKRLKLAYTTFCEELIRSSLTQQEKYKEISETNSCLEIIRIFTVKQKNLQDKFLKMCISFHLLNLEILYFKIKVKIRSKNRI